RLARRQKTVQTSLANFESLYQINITVGTPGQTLGLQIDTGSSDVWFPSSSSSDCQQNECVGGAFDSDSSSTFVDVAANAFQIQYVDGTTIQGDYIRDTLRIGNTAISNMTMALASDTGGSPEGIMGIGYVSDETIVQTNPEGIYPNVPVQLQNQGYINTVAYSLWLNDLDANTGSILFGGVDSDKYHGDLIGLPVQPDSQTNSITSFTVALSSMNLTTKAGTSVYNQATLDLPAILDSGTTLTYLPDNLATDILQGVGAINDRDFGYIVRCSLGDTGANFNFGFGGSGGPVITVPMNEMLIPLTDQNGSPLTFRNGDEVCNFGINPAGSDPILFGDTFLRSAYVVYDLHNNQIALANTNFNATSSSIQEITNSTVPGVSSVASGVTVTQTATGAIHQTTGVRSRATGDAGATAASATFDFGATGTSGSSSSSSTKTGAAAAVLPPRMALETVAMGGVVVLSALFGGSLFIL
ncbi:acid protease, partial [Saccharata proteae CBS 121410]